VILMMTSQPNDPPILICADLQTEYVTEGRSHVITDAEAITSRCLQLMTVWRDNLWPVMHFKTDRPGSVVQSGVEADGLDCGAEAEAGGATFEHPLPSAYSSTRFAEYMSNMKNIRCVLLGFSLDETILSTVVDGFHRSHRYEVVSDAVACRGPGVGDPAAYKLAVIKVIGHYAGIQGSRDLVGASGKIAV
jgi:Amidases related to nicotinamidase